MLNRRILVPGAPSRPARGQPRGFRTIVTLTRPWSASSSG